MVLLVLLVLVINKATSIDIDMEDKLAAMGGNMYGPDDTYILEDSTVYTSLFETSGTFWLDNDVDAVEADCIDTLDTTSIVRLDDNDVCELIVSVDSVFGTVVVL